MDGLGNNLDHPTWGMAGTALLKLAPTSYADGISTPTILRPNARTISNVVFAQSESVPNASQASDILWQWGQFIDHDITLSLDNPEEPFPVRVPQEIRYSIPTELVENPSMSIARYSTPKREQINRI
ncbi:MAG: peroxidase family protein [Acidimicrobiia bacterium]|nr:peroxidase family protein [Acidimicrobiia bacterium]